MIVKLKRHHLDYFKKKALKSKNEIYAMLIGYRISPTVVLVDHFKYPKLDTSTPEEVIANWQSYVDIEDMAKQDGMVVVGDIHSHPEDDTAMSKSDYKDHKINNRSITGIVGVINKKPFIQFWEVSSPLPCTLEYV
jgi:proteasome lid subunit RPN8/RPN11